jgi:dienelactone hydrolase
MFSGALLMASCNSQEEKAAEPEAVATPDIKEESVSYTADTVTLNGFVAYDANAKDKRPVVLVVHEWWGLGDYVRNRARQLAEMGYVAMAVDIFGNGKTADNPADAGKLATPFYQNPELARSRLEAAINKVSSYAQADTSRIAAIGYCFGGAVVLNTARLGSNLDGVVSFHGNLVGVPADKSKLKAAVLVCHGNADSFVPQQEVDQFKKQMDSIGDYTFKAYDSATHAFTNPNATETGKKHNLPIAYNEAADKSSWADMKAFLDRIFK